MQNPEILTTFNRSDYNQHKITNQLAKNPSQVFYSPFLVPLNSLS